ncbi:MAG TPA: DUF4244 domain-containing protein [Marmoricola sp.]|nr:DUF4244 domain-containing protein [Marmoricola sp.]
MRTTTLDLVRDRNLVRDDWGTTTAEYAVCTGAATGFGCLLYKFLTSDMGQQLLKLIFDAIKALIPF